jgi:hypothetical protein
MKNFKIVNDLVLVEKVLIKNVGIETVGSYKGVVKILQFGEKVEDRMGLEVGDKVLMKEHCGYTCPYTQESYIYLEQIVRTVL